MKYGLRILASLLLVASLAGCAQQKIAEQKVEKEVKEVVVPKSESVAETARDFIMSSDKLTDAQKTKLLELQQATQAQSVYLKEEIEKNRIVLLKIVLEPKMNQREYEILKKKITALEKKKLENGFNAITAARKIIEPAQNDEKKEFYRAYMNSHFQDY